MIGLMLVLLLPQRMIHSLCRLHALTRCSSGRADTYQRPIESVPRASDGRVSSQVPGQPGGHETGRSQQAEMIEDYRWLHGKRAVLGDRVAAHAPLHSRRVLQIAKDSLPAG